jgi:hypothetical protein
MDNPVPTDPNPASAIPAAPAETPVGFPQPTVAQATPPVDVPAPASDHTEVFPGGEKPKSKTNLLMIVAIVLLLGAIGVLGFFVFRNMTGSSKEVPTPTPTPIVTAIPTETASPSATPALEPVVSSPSAGMKVVSPLKVVGKVPSEWMFEGVFPVKLVDSTRKVIIAGQGKEKVAGSWTTPGLIDFESTLTFTTTAKAGFLILEKDNPSGLPENDKSFEVPVTF